MRSSTEYLVLGAGMHIHISVVPLDADMRNLPAPEVPVSESQIVHPALPGESTHALGQMMGTHEVQETRSEGANAPVGFHGVLCRSDGSALGNRGAGGAGAVCYRINQSGLWPEPTMVSHFLGPRITNSEAEYEGVLMSLKLVYQKLVDLPDDSDPIEVRLECDSNLVVGQLNGAAAGKNTPHPAL